LIPHKKTKTRALLTSGQRPALLPSTQLQIRVYRAVRLPDRRLLLEEKLSPKVTDEVLPQYDFAESFLKNALPAAHLIRPCGAPSPPGEGFS